MKKNISAFLCAVMLFLTGCMGASSLAGGTDPAGREKKYFEECSFLVTPESVADVYASNHSSSTVNGTIKSISYTFKAKEDADLSKVMTDYKDLLTAEGMSVEEDGESFRVSKDNTLLATVTYKETEIEINIEPGTNISDEGDVERETVYFEEHPSLPTPESVAAVYQSGHSSGSTNGQVTKDNYTFSSSSNADLSAVMQAYGEFLSENGFEVSDPAAESFTVFSDGEFVANVRLENPNIIVDFVE